MKQLQCYHQWYLRLNLHSTKQTVPFATVRRRLTTNHAMLASCTQQDKDAIVVENSLRRYLGAIHLVRQVSMAKIALTAYYIPRDGFKLANDLLFS